MVTSTGFVFLVTLFGFLMILIVFFIVVLEVVLVVTAAVAAVHVSEVLGDNVITLTVD